MEGQDAESPIIPRFLKGEGLGELIMCGAFNFSRAGALGAWRGS